MLEYTNKKEGKYMTDLELKQARETYKMQVEGQQMLLERVANKAVFAFTKQYFSNVSEESIMSISKDEILRNAFLSIFGNTKESSQILFYINCIQRKDACISDGRPELTSIDWSKGFLDVPKPLNKYNLYCDLETNQPRLIELSSDENNSDQNIIFIPNHFLKCPSKETYFYSSKSLEKITKGYATEPFNRLQLYYFRQLLETSRDEAVKRVKSLDAKEINAICNLK